MAKRYATVGKDTNTANTTILYLVTATSVRPRIYDVILSSPAAADNAAEYTLRRFTAQNATPGGTVKTPQALDPADPAAAASGREAPTGEPTYTSTADLLTWPQNQRATFRWVASPGGELIIPATSDNGIGLLSLSVTSAFSVTVTFHHEE